MLDVRNLTVHYGAALALSNVSLRVEDRELVSVIGPNGAGKTTLLRAISGMVKPDKGSTITFDESPIGKLETWNLVKMGIVHCPERRKPFPEFTVLENLMMGAYIRKDKDEVRKDLERVHELFPVLKERGGQMAGTLSGGEQQMLAIARALMSKPRLLLVDEPSLGLAPAIKKGVFECIKEIQRSGQTILLVEQDVRFALDAADRIYVLAAGRVVAEGTKKDLIKATDIRRAYLGM